MLLYNESIIAVLPHLDNFESFLLFYPKPGHSSKHSVLTSHHFKFFIEKGR